jgi:hypothetical protein
MNDEEWMYADVDIQAERVRPAYLRPLLAGPNDRLEGKRLELARAAGDAGGGSVVRGARAATTNDVDLLRAGGSVGRPPPRGGQTHLRIVDIAG